MTTRARSFRLGGEVEQQCFARAHHGPAFGSGAAIPACGGARDNAHRRPPSGALLTRRPALARGGRALLVSMLALAASCGENRPYFESVLLPDDTPSTSGPLLVEAWVVSPEGLQRVELRLESEGQEISRMAMVELAQHGESRLFGTELPPRPAGFRYSLRLVALAADGAKTSYPPLAEPPVRIEVLPPGASPPP